MEINEAPVHDFIRLEDGGRLVLRVKFPDGAVEYGDGVTPDEATAFFWKALGGFIAAQVEGESKRERRYKAALVWALGAGDEFPERKERQGAYWWRSELQARAGLEWDGKRFVEGEVGWMVRPERLRKRDADGVDQRVAAARSAM